MHYFLIYKDGTHDHFIENLLESVRTFGKQFKIIEYHKSDIDEEFRMKNENILSLTRGGGYWLWKPYIIYNTLKKINNGDILFYLDSKYYFIEDFSYLYTQPLKTKDIVVWKNKPNEQIWYMRNWCKMDVIFKYDMFDKIFNENAEDCWAGAIVVKKTEKTLEMIHEWLEMSSNFENITDSQSITPNYNEFVEHRHDQSLLSIVLHKNNIPLEFFEKRYLQNCTYPYEI